MKKVMKEYKVKKEIRYCPICDEEHEIVLKKIAFYVIFLLQEECIVKKYFGKLLSLILFIAAPKTLL